MGAVEVEMKKWQWIVPAILTAFTLHADESVPEEDITEEEYDIEEEICDNQDFCIPEEQRCYSRRYRLPHRYCDYYDYEDRDIDATWPGKRENSFMEELMR